MARQSAKRGFAPDDPAIHLVRKTLPKIDDTRVKPAYDELRAAQTPLHSSIIIPQIFRDAVGLVEIVPIVEIAVQQRAGLALVIRRHVAGLRQSAPENIAVILIVRLRADEDADAVVRLGIEVTNIAAVVVDDKAMRRQRPHCFLPGGIIGKLHAKSGRGKQKTVLLEERFARCFQRRQ